MLAGCTGVYEGRRIGGVEWHAVDINGVPVPGERPLTLRLEGKSASGSAGCNRFSGSYRLLNQQQIEISGLTSTRMACDAAVMEQERRYISILESARGFNFYGNGNLSLIAADGRAIRFRNS